MAEAAVERLVRIVGVRFKRAGKIYYFDPGDLDLAPGDRVLVETAAGVEFGEVVVPVKMVPESEVVPPIRPVLREAVREDYDQLLANREKERIAHAFALERIAARGLPMRLVNTEYTFDRNRLTFFFTSETRVDFRQLVRDLARRFGVRIELRQIGVRDEAKEVGGIGMCGRELCCSSWMGEFEPVSIRMAKEQKLSLNPSKLTGQCGRLKCCLKFENDTYRQIRDELPDEGDLVRVTKSGEELVGRVIEVLVARERVVLDLGKGQLMHVSLAQFERGEAEALTGKLARRAGSEAADEAPREGTSSEGTAELDDLAWDMAAGDERASSEDEYAAALELETEPDWDGTWDYEALLELDKEFGVDEATGAEAPELGGLVVDPEFVFDEGLDDALAGAVVTAPDERVGEDEALNSDEADEPATQGGRRSGRRARKGRKGRSGRGKAKAAGNRPAGSKGSKRKRQRRSKRKGEAGQEGRPDGQGEG